MIYLIILGVVAWYGLGLVGSAIGAGATAKWLDKLFPMLPPHDTRGDKVFCYLMAIVGIFNLISATVWGLLNTRSITLRWEWLK